MVSPHYRNTQHTEMRPGNLGITVGHVADYQWTSDEQTADGIYHTICNISQKGFFFSSCQIPARLFFLNVLVVSNIFELQQIFS